MADEAPDIDDLLAELRQRVEKRREAGLYPVDLEASLDDHFRRVAQFRTANALEELEARLLELADRSRFARDQIRADSRVPGGTAVHRAVGIAVSRQIEGVLQQLRDFADGVRDALQAVAGALEDPTGHVHADLLGQVDSIFERLASMEKGPPGNDAGLGDLRRRVDLLEAAEQRRTFKPWFHNDRFEEVFRGTRPELLERYRGLAGRFHNCAPVLDLGCGRGEFLELLKDEGIDASGIEIDPELVAECRRRGFDADVGDALAALSKQVDGALGGIVMIQVVEHLTPQDVLEVIARGFDKLRPGGRMVVETVNPMALYVFAHSFYVDPTHTQPVHPAYLEFVFREAGFSEVLVEWRSPPPAQDILVAAGDGGIGDENVARLNNLLFGAQEYAIIATR